MMMDEAAESGSLEKLRASGGILEVRSRSRVMLISGESRRSSISNASHSAKCPVRSNFLGNGDFEAGFYGPSVYL